jgi:Transglycosylase SLT domain
MVSASRRSPRGNRRLAILLAAVAILAAVVIAATSGGGSVPPLPAPRAATPVGRGDAFPYVLSREPQFVARATVGSAHVLFTKSPGGVIATAGRVSRFRGVVDSVTRGSGIDPNLVEAVVFVESAGRPNVIAGSDPAAAAGLTQILADTGRSLLGMRIDLAASRKLTKSINLAAAAGKASVLPGLERRRAAIDDRFDPRKALEATVRYLQIAGQRFGRPDLAAESYHMGMGNLQNVLGAYDGGAAVPYAQLYFDTGPDHHRAAWALLSSFGDDSSLYYWKLLAAQQIMRLYRSDRAALVRLTSLQTAMDSAAEVLHPPDRSPPFSDPGALDRAYAAGTILPLPSNPAALGLAYDAGIGSEGHTLGVKPALYRGLRPAALELLTQLAARVRTLAHGAGPLIVTSAVTDARYQRVLGVSDPPAAGGWSFTIARRYVSAAQAGAFQAMLDRLQALNLIAWQRFPGEIEVTVASDAPRVIAGGV